MLSMSALSTKLVGTARPSTWLLHLVILSRSPPWGALHRCLNPRRPASPEAVRGCCVSLPTALVSLSVHELAAGDVSPFRAASTFRGRLAGISRAELAASPFRLRGSSSRERGRGAQSCRRWSSDGHKRTRALICRWDGGERSDLEFFCAVRQSTSR